MDDYEKTVLGACFLADGIDEAISLINADDFRSELNRSIYRSVVEIADDGGIPDIVVVSDKLKSKGIDDISDYLVEIVNYTPTAANLNYYAKKLKDASLRHRLVSMAQGIINEKEQDGSHLLDMVHHTINQREDEACTEKAGHIIKNVMKNMESRYNNRGKLLGLPTGIKELDNLTSGLCNGNMIVLAARPSIGKTALAMNIVESVSVHNGIPAIFFTLEMGQAELIERAMLSLARVDSGRARAGMFGGSDWSKMSTATGKIHTSPLWIDRASGNTIAQIKAKARAAKRRHGIKLVVIDYLGLVGGKGTEYERITNASIETKNMATELNLPVLCLHQLNRGNEQRADKTPGMSDLRSSGQIEQDADVIMLLHREKQHAVEEALVIVEKQRNGPCGRIPVTWNGPFNRFEDKI